MPAYWSPGEPVLWQPGVRAQAGGIRTDVPVPAAFQGGVNTATWWGFCSSLCLAVVPNFLIFKHVFHKIYDSIFRIVCMVKASCYTIMVAYPCISIGRF